MISKNGNIYSEMEKSELLISDSLNVNNQIFRWYQIGTILERPITPVNDQLYSDITLGKLILYNGTT